MKVNFGHDVLEYPSETFGQLRDSSALLADPAALRTRMAEDGYLLMRGLIGRQKVLEARRSILSYMAEHEALEKGSRPLDGVMGQYGKSVSMMGRKPVTQSDAVRAVLEAPELFDFYSRYFEQPVLTFDFKWLRAVGHEEFTGAHLDVVYMGRGTLNLLTCWIPLADIPIEQGTLAICVGSHREPGFQRVRDTYGRMDVDRDRTEGHFSSNPAEITAKFGGKWATSEFQAGDVLTFGMFTMHASTTNTTDRWRLSCDVRFQPSADPVDPRWVGINPVAHQGGAPTVTMAEARKAWGV